MKVISEKEYDELECPGCKAKIKVEKEPPTHTISHNGGLPVTELEAFIGKEVEKRIVSPKKEAEKEKEMIKEIEYPSYIPGEYCASGNCDLGGVHPNKNYKTKVTKRCNNCKNMAPGKAPKCAWCGENDWEQMDDEDLENMGISLPKLEEEHVHAH